VSSGGNTERIGPYVLLGAIARGGMGAVYRSRHPTTGHDLAIKVLLRGRGASQAQRQRFQRECRALTRLRHPGLVEVVDSGEERGVPWLAMRLIPGQSLEDRLRERGALTPGHTLELGLQLCDAMAAAHLDGVLHRDLKPDNVHCTPQGRYVITDFGLAKNMEIEESVRLSHSGILQGTPGFWAPEQAAGRASEATERTDVYGLGAVLYAALSGVPPIQGESLAEVLHRTANAPPEPLSRSRDDVPRWLERLVLRCLEKSPLDRPANVAEVGEALRRGDPSSRGRARGALLALCAVALLALPLALRAEPPTSADSTPSPSSSPTTTPTPPEPDLPSQQELYERARDLSRSNPPEARKLARRAAEAGHSEAAFALGFMLRQGIGGPADLEQALKWFRRGAERGSTKAMREVASAYEDGRGVVRDLAQAYTWYCKAAEGGDREAMVSRGHYLAEGLSAPPDPSAAATWFRRAADMGSPAAMENLGKGYLNGKGVPRDPRQGVAWLERATELGSSSAMVTLAGVLQSGLGGAPRDPAKAVRLLREAARRGDAGGMSGLGYSLEHGVGVAKDVPAAADWYRQAAAKGDAVAMTNLGTLLVVGKDIPQDAARAAELFRDGARLGQARSMCNLGLMYQRGTGVTQDSAAAASWLRKAIVASERARDPDTRARAQRALKSLAQ
jgi:TPR repeat protein